MKISALSIQKQTTRHIVSRPFYGRASSGRDKTFPVTRPVHPCPVARQDKSLPIGSYRETRHYAAIPVTRLAWPQHTDSCRANRLGNPSRGATFQATNRIWSNQFMRLDTSTPCISSPETGRASSRHVCPGDNSSRSVTCQVFPGPRTSPARAVRYTPRLFHGQDEIVPRRCTPSVSGALKTKGDRN